MKISKTIKTKLILASACSVLLALPFGLQAAPTTCPNAQDVLNALVQNASAISIWTVEVSQPVSHNSYFAFHGAMTMGADSNSDYLPDCYYTDDSSGRYADFELEPDMQDSMTTVTLVHPEKWSSEGTFNILCNSSNVQDCGFTVIPQ